MKTPLLVFLSANIASLKIISGISIYFFPSNRAPNISALSGPKAMQQLTYIVIEWCNPMLASDSTP